MEAEENSEIISKKEYLLLLAKKRRLIELREDLLRRQCQVEEGNLSSENPDSPIVPGTPASITPPPFSPLTPLINKTLNNQGGKAFCVSNPCTPETNKQVSPLSKNNNNEMYLEYESNPDTPLSHILNDISVNDPISTPALLKYIEKEPHSSPIPPMSPETQKLFNDLTENDLIYFEGNASDVVENSDLDSNGGDNVADSNFVINLENELETDCKSHDDDEDRTKTRKVIEGEGKYSDKEQKKAKTLVVKKDRLVKKAKTETGYKNLTRLKDEHETPVLLPKKSTRCEENDVGTVTNLESLETLTMTLTPKKRPRNEGSISFTPKNKNVTDILKFTPEKETRNDKEHNSDIPPNDEQGTLKITPVKNTIYEENDSPVLNTECLEILTFTTEKEISNKEHRNTTPPKDENETFISTHVTKTRKDANDNSIPNIQILEKGNLLPENVAETITIENNSDLDSNCDDSVADPDFDVNLENELETDCESSQYDDDEDRTKKGKVIKGKYSDTEQKKAKTLVVKKDRLVKKVKTETGYKSLTRLKDEHETPVLLPKKSTRCEENDVGTVTNLESLETLTMTSTPKKRPRNEGSISFTPKNKNVTDIHKFTPEKETRNDKEHNSDIPPNDEQGTLKITPVKSTIYEENDSPVLNTECLEILTFTTEKEISTKEHRNTTPPKDENETFISTHVTKTRKDANDNSIPNIQILEKGNLSPENVAETITIENNSDLDSNCDDSVADPDFDVNLENELETDCESSQYDDDEDRTKKRKVIKGKYSDTEQKKAKTLVVKKDRLGKKARTEAGYKSLTPEKEGNENLIPNIQILGKGNLSSDNENVAETNSIENNLIPNIQILEKGNLSSDHENVAETNSIENNELVASTSKPCGRPRKGRKRKHLQTSSERKFNKYNNLQYTTVHNKKKIEPKVFIDYKCKCLKECHNLIPEETRKEEFQKFVKLGSYNAQLLYIGSCIKEERKKRSYTLTSVPAEKKKPRQFHRTYTLKGVKVCRDMFLNTLQITTQKVTITLMKMRNNSLNDGRGSSSGGWNKLSEDDVNFIVEVISKLPKYESHYRREKNNEALYLEPGMTLSKLYEIYQKEFKQKFGSDQNCASFASVKKVFFTKFNLRCKTLKKDTCNKCDLFAIQLQNAKSLTEKEQIEAEKSKHLEKAETLRNQMNRDFTDAQENENIECLSFDLEKTLPLPRIPTNVVFYKRQLWFYNSGIHSASNDVGHCYVWVEGQAGRGAQEVGSCLIKYIETKLRPTAEHLILWSDCCGGQNRNIKIVVMLKAILNTHPTLKKISFRFLESGHTFLPNDTDFSKIETALNKQQRVYTAEEYIHIIQNARKTNPLQVYKMEKTDFYSTENIEKKITNRKKFTDNTKVNWLEAKEIMIEKEKPYSIFMRPSFEQNFKELNVQKKSRGQRFGIDKSDFSPLWPNGKAIAPAKLADLQSLFKYIPEDCLQFYRELKASPEIVDDVDGYGGETDFIPDIQE